jgi:hypothetical protein
MRQDYECPSYGMPAKRVYAQVPKLCYKCTQSLSTHRKGERCHRDETPRGDLCTTISFQKLDQGLGSL